jgi:hypothetical protein
VLDNVNIGLGTKDTTVNLTDVKYLGIIYANKDFRHAIKGASLVGRDAAELEIMNYFRSSQFFRDVQGYDHFTPIAKKIMRDSTRTDIPYWQFKNDIRELRIDMKDYGMSTEFIDNLFEDPSIRPHSLFWKYSSNSGYILQCTLFQAIFLLMIIFLEKLKLNNLKKVRLIRLFQLILPAVSGVLFWMKPQSVNIIYWVIPGFIFLMSMLLSYNHRAD